MASSSLWDDNIVWGDSSLSTINAIDLDLDTSRKSSANLDTSPKSSASSRSKQDASRGSPNSPRLVVSQRGRLGKRRSWFDWTVDSDDEASNEMNASQLCIEKSGSQKQNPKQRRRSIDEDLGEEIKNIPIEKDKTAPTSFIPRPLLMLSLSPLEDEGTSAKEFKKISRRRSVECERPKSLSGSLQRSTRDLAKFVRKVSNNSSDEELDVPFPLQPRESSRRRSAW